MGTPGEAEWPGVTQLADYKSSFPKWEVNPSESIKQIMNNRLDEPGQDLLLVSVI